MRSSAEIIEEVRQEIPEVSVDEVKAEQDRDGDFVLLDVRDDDERRRGIFRARFMCRVACLSFRLMIM